MPYPAGPGHVEIQTQGEPGWRAKSKARLGPQEWGLAPGPVPAILLGFHHSLHWPLGVPRLYCPGKIVPKLCFMGPGTLLVGGGMEGGPLGVCWCLVCSLAQAEVEMEHVRSLSGSGWALVDRKRIEKREWGK